MGKIVVCPYCGNRINMSKLNKQKKSEAQHDEEELEKLLKKKGYEFGGKQVSNGKRKPRSIK